MNIDIVMDLAAVVLTVVGTWGVRRLWRHDVPYFDDRQPWWPGGNESWRAWLRTVPLASALFVFLVLVAVFGPLVPEQPKDGLGFVRPIWFVGPIAAVLIVGMGLVVSLYISGRPSLLVPPHLRHR